MITFDRYGFQGVVDGQGHTIRGLRISKPGGGGIGLFGVLGQRGTVRNLNVDDAAVVGRGGTGVLVGSNFGIVYRCSAQGDVAGELALGVLVGGSGGLVAYSESSGTVSGNQAIGGLSAICGCYLFQPVRRRGVRQPRYGGAGWSQYVRVRSQQLHYRDRHWQQ